jgi:hypothetical protein
MAASQINYDTRSTHEEGEGGDKESEEESIHKKSHRLSTNSMREKVN